MRECMCGLYSHSCDYRKIVLEESFFCIFGKFRGIHLGANTCCVACATARIQEKILVNFVYVLVSCQGLSRKHSNSPKINKNPRTHPSRTHPKGQGRSLQLQAKNSHKQLDIFKQRSASAEGQQQQQTTNNKQQTTNNKQQTTNNKQQTTNNKQQTTNNKQQTTTNKQQPTTTTTTQNDI